MKMTTGDYIEIISISVTMIVSIVGEVYAVANNIKNELAET